MRQSIPGVLHSTQRCQCRTPFCILEGIMFICPECGKEVGTPVYNVNPTLLNLIGAGGAQVITFVPNAVSGQPLYTNFTNNVGNPVSIPQIMNIPLRLHHDT